MTRGSAATAPASQRKAARLVTDLLDDMPVGERTYHHLKFSAPLVADVVRRARQHVRAGDLALLIGGNSLMIESLAELGVRLDVCAIAGTQLTDAARRYVLRTITPGDLEQLVSEQAYSCVVLPMLLEAVALERAASVLRALRALLAENGCAIIATANQSSLDARLAAVAGRPLMANAGTDAVSLSWPSVARSHVYHRDELLALAREAGLAVHRCDYVTPHEPFMEMELLGIFAYGARRLGTATRRALPSTRDALVMECGRRSADGDAAKTRTDTPSVSVVVCQRFGGDRLRETLASLTRQTYPPDQYEVVVLDDGSRDDTAGLVAHANAQAACRVRALDIADRGPRARNIAMTRVTSDITAHTEDTCVLPEDWIESAVAWFDADTAAVTGPVFAAEGSVGRFLEVACTRPDPDEKAPPSEVMFPITNVFYRTNVARAAGGFDEALGAGDGATTGWDSELAWRLTRLGWQARFREEVYQFRFFPHDPLAPGWARRQFRQAVALPRLMSAVPELRRRTLVNGAFASRQTMYFDLALASAALAGARRNPRWLLLGAPWVSTVSARVDAWPPRNWPASARAVAQIAARQAVWLGGFVAGSIRARRVVL